MKNKDIMNYWDFGKNFEPRQTQIKALRWLEQQTAKYIILEAPTGTGKSALAITYSKYLGQRTKFGDSFILTPQRILQKQYDESFSNISEIDLSSLYGKSNYICKNKNTHCGIGSLVKSDCGTCPYKTAKEDAKYASNTVLNYKLALVMFGYTEFFNRRKLIVLDECHTLENHLVEFDAVAVSEWFSNKYDLPFKKHNDMIAAKQWVVDCYLDPARDKLDELRDRLEPVLAKLGPDLTRNDIKFIQEVEHFEDHLDNITLMAFRTDEYVNSNYVLINDNISFKFKRLYGKYSFDKILKPQGERFLFMSSTILDKDGFCNDLGIPPEDTAFISLESDFPPENRNVYYMPQMKVNYKWNDNSNFKQRKNMIDCVTALCDSHDGESGIIHTANFAIAEWIAKEIAGKIPQRIFVHEADSEFDRNEVIDNFIGCEKPSVLISPSSTEGLDLKYDLGRFAIFVKTPYLFLGDQWIKKRMDLSPDWYSRQAMINIIQGGGRIVRAGDDVGTTYILDGSFARLMQDNYDITPQWWKDSYKKI